VLPYGAQAVLVELDPDEPTPAALCQVLHGASGVAEAWPGARTVLVEYDARGPDNAGDALNSALSSALAAGRDERGGPDVPSITIDVRYDGADLADVAAATGLSVDDVVARHCAPTYTVAFCGFVPGFAYLTGIDPVLQLPRLAEPRTQVPAGSVGIAGEFTGVYPRPSPGGWRLLGRTDATLWQVGRDPPALLPPGATVRFAPR
jgi:KipI family sensor histidine kinase inhibitor